MPDYIFHGIKYASVLTIELREDNRCLSNGYYRQNCFSIRMKYNGQYIYLLKAKMFEDSAIQEKAYADYDSNVRTV